MDRDLAEAARKIFADNLFETVRQNYCEESKDYLEKQIKIASAYLSKKQKSELRSKGINL